MESKIRIKLGPIEVEFEGSESFLKSELPALIKTVSELYKASDVAAPDEDEPDAPAAPGGKIELSTNSMAAKLNCKTGADLAVAAAAHIAFAKGQSVFSRKELLDEMKTASGYYKNNYSGNLTKILNGLVKSKFNEPSTGKYALRAALDKELRTALAD